MKIIDLIAATDHLCSLYEFHFLFAVRILEGQLHGKRLRCPPAQFVVFLGEHLEKTGQRLVEHFDVRYLIQIARTDLHPRTELCAEKSFLFIHSNYIFFDSLFFRLTKTRTAVLVEILQAGQALLVAFGVELLLALAGFGQQALGDDRAAERFVATVHEDAVRKDEEHDDLWPHFEGISIWSIWDFLI